MITNRSLQSGEPFKVNDKLIIKHPKINEIRESDETETNYNNFVSLFALKPYDLMVELDDIGIDYSTLNNYELFLRLYTVPSYKESFKFFLRGFDFRMCENKQNNEIVLYDGLQDVTIDRLIYSEISSFIKKINFISDKTEFNPGNKFTRKMIIEETRRKQKRRLKNGEEQDSQLSNKIRFLVWNNQLGIDYNKVGDLYVYQFYEGIYSIRKSENYKQTVMGVYAGNIDQKSVDFDKIDWSTKISL